MTETIALNSKVELAVIDYAIHGNAILGIKESGKSYTATMFAERLMDAGIPIIAFDPIGIWRYLRVEGSGPGYPVVVAGGQHGDLPLTPATAAAIVRAAIRDQISLVLDLYSMELSKSDWRKIVEAALHVLLYENSGLRHIFIEEAAEFAPQRIGPDQGRVYAEVEKLARMGGNVQLGYTLINPRAADVNKSVLELCDTLFLFRQKGKNSIEALGKWLKAADAHGAEEIQRSLATLGQGECWVWLGESDRPVRVKRMPAKRTFHPDRRTREHGMMLAGQMDAVDVSQFVATMRATLAELARATSLSASSNEGAKSNAPAAVAAVSAAKDRAEAQREIERARREGFAEGARVGRAARVPEIQRAVATLRNFAQTIAALADEIERAEPPPINDPIWGGSIPADGIYVTDGSSFESWSGGDHPALVPDGSRFVRVKETAPDEPDAPLHSAARAVLQVVIEKDPIRMTWPQVTSLAGISPRGGHFNAGRRQLRDRRLILETADNRVGATAHALALYGEEMRGSESGRLVDKLQSGARALLETLARLGAKLTWPQAATLAGISARGGHFNAGRQQLRQLELIDESGGLVAASALGLAECGAQPVPTSGKQLFDLWCEKLVAPANAMLRYIAEHEPVTAEELAAGIGASPRGGHWNSGLKTLRNNGLVERAPNGRYSLSATLGSAA